MIPVSSETKNTGIIREFLLDGSSGLFYGNVDYNVRDGYVRGDYIRVGYIRVGYIRAGYSHDDYTRGDYTHGGHNRVYRKPRQWHYV